MFSVESNPANVDNRTGFGMSVPTHPNKNVRSLTEARDRLNAFFDLSDDELREAFERHNVIDDLTTDDGYIVNGQCVGLSYFHDDFSSGLLKRCNAVNVDLCRMRMFVGTFAEWCDLLSFARVASTDPWQIKLGSGESALYLYSPLNAINRPINPGRSSALRTDVLDNGRWICNEPGLIHLEGFILSLQHRTEVNGQRSQIDPHFTFQIPLIMSGLTFVKDRVDTANKRDLSDYVAGWKLFGTDPANIVHPCGEHWGATHGIKYRKKLDTTAKETVSKAISHYAGKQLDSGVSDNTSDADKVLRAIGDGDFETGKDRLASWVKTVQDLDLSETSKVKAPSGAFSSKLSFPTWAICLWGLYKYRDVPQDAFSIPGQENEVPFMSAILEHVRAAVTDPGRGMKRAPIEDFVFKGSKGAVGAKTPAKFAGICNVLDTLDAIVRGQLDATELVEIETIGKDGSPVVNEVPAITLLDPAGRCFKSSGNPATKAGSTWTIPYDSPVIDSALRS